MRILFTHSNFPAQFVHLVSFLRQNPKNQLVFLTAREDWELPGVYKAVYKAAREKSQQTHPFLQGFETAVLNGQAAYRTAAELKAKGFVPDLIYGASGWGSTLYLKDLFPNTPMACYFEWFYRPHGGDAEFGPWERISPEGECRVKVQNSAIAVDLYSCDGGICPTYWQHSQFPQDYLSKIKVIHDGINTHFCAPAPNRQGLSLANLELSGEEEIVTYVGRGMEPYRGFPQFMEAAALLLKRRPKCHVVVVGSDRVVYGSPAPDGKSYKDKMLEKLDVDLNRIHFTGHLNKNDYIKVLQASLVHIYLTRPFVLSWSMLEAMSCGCVIVGSDTQPVREVINHGVNGLLADFFSPQDIAGKVEEALDDSRLRRGISYRARETILDRYDVNKMLPRHLQRLQEIAESYYRGRQG
ncbi:MAG: glycosyltransferase [Negativicutes bacterium]|nr:glycosyltransferase [Negativicutes bacterium]